MKNGLYRLNNWCWTLVSRQTWLAAVLAGVLLVLAFPPINLAPLAILGWVLLLMVLEVKVFHQPERLPRWRAYWRSFRFTYLAFLVWNTGTCYWLLNTGHGMADTETRMLAAIAGVLALVLNPLLQSIPILVFVSLRRRLTTLPALVAMVVCFVAFEYLHLHWELTWSWITLGNAFAAWPWYVQYAELTGTLGISVFILVAAALLFGLARAAHWHQPRGRLPLWLGGWLVAPLIAWAILALPFRAVYQPVGHKTVRVVQPNIDPYREKFNDLSLPEQLKPITRLMNAPGADSIQLFVLPETAIPRRVDDNMMRFDQQLNPLRKPGGRDTVSVLTGMVYLKVFPPDAPDIPVSARCAYNSPQDTRPIYCWDSWNAATLFTPGVQPVAYQKAKLVPFSERVPYMETLELLKKYEIDLGGGFGSFGKPDSIHIFRTLRGTGIAPIICYESIFGDYVRELVNLDAHLLCILTNDGWWKQSSGYLQHAAYARLRAIETRRWIARSANTGESSFISATGSVYQPTDWWVPTVIDRRIPLLAGRTLYTRLGDWPGYLAVFLLPFFLIGWRWFPRQLREKQPR